MTLKAYIWGMRFVVFFSLLALAGVIAYVDPENSRFFGKLIFFGVLFFVLAGSFNLFLLFVRRKTLGEETAFSSLGLSFRQSVLLSLMASILLVLQGFRMLVWWDGLLVVAGVFLIELYFLSRIADSH